MVEGESMSSGMAFRKDCADCGRSFLTKDRKTNLCPRCAGKNQQIKTSKEKQSKPLAAPKPSIEIRSPLTLTDDLKPHGPKEDETHKERSELPEGRVRGDAAKPKVSKPGARTPGIAKGEIALTEDQEQEIIERYQAYVQGMERPREGRRKRIAFEMELPYRTVVLTVRKWSQNQSQGKDLSREERFLVEKSYFRFLEKESSFLRAKGQIVQETGLSQWQVSRYLDLLHDGEDRLCKVPDVSPEQRTAILAEYHAYLSAPAPPAPPLHASIAGKTGVDSKQVHKVLLAYRLGRFRERWK
jgi:hypothetical protein